MYKAEEYTYRVFWSEEDNCFITTVAEWPRLSSVEDTQQASFSGMVELVRFLIAEMTKNGEEPPRPISKRRFSGHISLRMPKEQHLRVAIEAAEQGVSLNQLLISRI